MRLISIKKIEQVEEQFNFVYMGWFYDKEGHITVYKFLNADDYSSIFYTSYQINKVLRG